MNRRVALALVLLAFAVRIGFMLACRTYDFAGLDDYVKVGEASSIARSIATGRGFSSPFTPEYTGPTAWIAPVYPYLLAAIFKVFGVFTTASAIAIFTLQSIFSALTVLPILGIAEKTVGRRAGTLSAALWAVFPWFSKWAVTWEWEVSLSAFLLASIIWLALCVGPAASWQRWAGLGVLEGLALSVNPALSTVVPVVLVWHAYKRFDWKKIGITIITTVVIMSPWIVRNRIVFDRWVFLRGNFGFEFALGNYHHSFGRGWGGFHPTGNAREYDAYKREGEAAYVAEKQRLAVEFIKEYPREFVELTAKRVSYFWDGSSLYYRNPIAAYWLPESFAVLSFLTLPALLVALRQRLFARELFVGILVLYPLPYYLTYSQPRYRHAIEPLLLILVSFAVIETYESLRSVLKYYRRNLKPLAILPS